MKNQRKRLGLLLAVMLLLQLALPAVALAADPPSELTNGDGFLVIHETQPTPDTGSYQNLGGWSHVEVTGPDGVIAPVYDPSLGAYVYDDVPDGASVEIVFTLHLEDTDAEDQPYTYAEGACFYLAPPAGVSLTKVQNQNFSGGTFSLLAEDKDNPGATWLFGTGELITDAGDEHRGQIKVTLNTDGTDGAANVNNRYDKWVSLKLNGSFDAIADGAPASDRLLLGTDTFIFNRRLPDVTSTTLEKELVSYDADTNMLSWKITVAQPNGVPLTGVSLVDVLSGSHTYIDGSFTVAANEAEAYTPTAPELAFDGAASTLTYQFPDGATGTYVFEYQTEITGFGSETGLSKTAQYSSFNNTATLYQGGDPIAGIGSVTDGATVDWIEKDTAAYVKYDENESLFAWTVTVHVPNNGKVTGAKIIDNIPEGLELFTGIGYKVKIDGNVVDQAGLDDPDKSGKFTISADGRTLTYYFPDATEPAELGVLNGTATLTYYTKITDRDTTIGTNDELPYSNKAYFDWDGNPSDSEYPTAIGNGKVPSLGLISKSPDDSAASEAYEYKTAGTFIRWTIRVNDNKVNLGQGMTTVTDTISADQRLVIDAEHPLVVAKDGEADPISTVIGTDGATASGTDANFGYTPENASGPEQFAYSFQGVTANDSYTITFYTRINDKSVENPGEHKESVTDEFYKNDAAVEFTNTAALTAPNNVTASDDAKKIFGSELIFKSGGTGYDYDTRIAKWTITVNKNKLPLTNAFVSDTLPTATINGAEVPLMVLVLDDSRGITVKDSTGATVAEAGNLEIAAVDGAASFTVKFLNAITDQYTIEFYTRLTDTGLSQSAASQGSSSLSFQNRAELTADEIGEAVTVDATGTLTVKNPALTKTAAVDEESGLIHWKTYVNLGRLELHGAVIRDTLQMTRYVTGSAKLTRLPNATLDANGRLASEGADPMVIFPLSGQDPAVDAPEVSYVNDVLTVELPDGGSDIYLLEFDTAIPADDIVGYVNQISLEATTGIGISRNSGTAVTINNYWSAGGGGNTAYKLTKFSKPGGGGVPVQGATYRLVNAAGVAIKRGEGFIEATTNELGVAEFSGLPNRPFYALEVSEPNGYSINPSPIPLVAGGNAVTHDDPIEGAYATLRVGKYSLYSGRLLSGGAFGLYASNADGSAISETPLFEPVASVNGEIVFENVPAGIYVIKEIEAPGQFLLTQDMVLAVVTYDAQAEADKVSVRYEVIIAGGSLAEGAYADYDGGNILINAPDTPGGGTSVTINKKCGAGNLTGGAFEIASADADSDFVPQTQAAQNGVITFTAIPAGEYVIREVTAPNGYLRTNATIRVTVGYNDDRTEYVVTFPGFAAAVTPALENVSDRGAEFTISKVSAYGDLPLTGGAFVLVGANGAETAITAASVNGKVTFQNVPVGAYTIKEKTAPAGYQLTKETIAVTVAYNADRTNYVVTFTGFAAGVTPKLKNQPEPDYGAIVRVNKVDSKTGGMLAGAQFTLYDASGRAVRTVTTDARGIAWFTDLPNGNYTIRETKAPVGYTASAYAIPVKAAGGFHEFTVPNAPYSSALVPTTGGAEGALGFVLAGLALVTLGFAIVKRRGMDA